MSEAELAITRKRIAHGPTSRIPNPPLGKSKPRYERMLVDQCINAGLGGFCGEYQFDDLRDWRIDIAFVEQKLAVEIDGAVHRIKSRFQADIEKSQALFFAGWRLLRVSPKQVREGDALVMIRRALA